jgi:hypothetical protein
MGAHPKLVFDSLFGDFPDYPMDYPKSHVNPSIINRVIKVFGFYFLLSLSNFLGVMQPDHAD